MQSVVKSSVRSRVSRTAKPGTSSAIHRLPSETLTHVVYNNDNGEILSKTMDRSNENRPSEMSEENFEEQKETFKTPNHHMEQLANSKQIKSADTSNEIQSYHDDGINLPKFNTESLSSQTFDVNINPKTLEEHSNALKKILRVSFPISESLKKKHFLELSKSQKDAFLDYTFRDSPSPQENYHYFKVLVLGEVSTGKTSFIRRYVDGIFQKDYRPTVGVDFREAKYSWGDTNLRIELWDIAGQERFTQMTRVYFRGATGAIIMYDADRPSSFEAISRWKRDLDSKCLLTDGASIPTILVANKIDMIPEINVEGFRNVVDFARSNGFNPKVYGCSARTGQGIYEIMLELVNCMIEVDDRHPRNIIVNEEDQSHSIGFALAQNVNGRNFLGQDTITQDQYSSKTCKC